MAVLEMSGRDIRQMVAITRRYPGDGGESLPWALLRDLKEVIPCDAVGVVLQDTPRWSWSDWQEDPIPETPLAELEAGWAAYQKHYWDSPHAYVDRTGDMESVLRISDLISPREMHNSGFYTEWMHGGDCQDEYCVGVNLAAGGPQRTVRISFVRGPGRDFSERDVAVLTLLRPHLQVAYDAQQRLNRGLLPLTRRQRDILQFVAAGYTNRQIARRLDVSEGTVRKHLENIFDRLEVESRTAAAARLRAER